MTIDKYQFFLTRKKTTNRYGKTTPLTETKTKKPQQ